MGQSKTRSPARKRKQDEIEQIPTLRVETDPDAPWASADDLDAGVLYEEIVLPVRNLRVRVRHLATEEIAQLELLPDLMGWVAEQSGDAKQKRRTLEESQKLASRWIHYQARLAHLATMRVNPDAPDFIAVAEPCSECGFEHSPSLWKYASTRGMNASDLEAICGIALRVQSVRWVRPFSEAPTPQTTPKSASTGA